MPTTSTNYWSPDDDTERWDPALYQNLPIPSGVPDVIGIRSEGKYQKITIGDDLSLGGQIALAAILRGAAEGTLETLEVPPGFARLRTILLGANTRHEHPEGVLRMFARALEPMRVEGGAEDLMDDLVAEEVARVVVAEVFANALAQFMALVVGDGDEAVTWLEFAGRGRYLDIMPRAMRNIEIPPNACAFTALAAAKVPQKRLKPLGPGRFVNISVSEIVAYLDSWGETYQFFDARGVMMVASRDDKRPKRFLVAKGHIRAFTTTTRAHENVFILRKLGSEYQEAFKQPEETLKLKHSSNSGEVDHFYRVCGIRASAYSAERAEVASWRVDARECYPNILQDPANVFPIACGDEIAEEWEEAQVREVGGLAAHGFYLVRWGDRVESMVMGREVARVWVLGQVIRQLWRWGPVPVYGEYVARDFALGKPVPLGERATLDDSEIFRRCAKDSPELLEAGCEDPRKLSEEIDKNRETYEVKCLELRRAQHLRLYSGWLEAERTEHEVGRINYMPAGPELNCIQASVEEDNQYDLMTEEAAVVITSERFYKRTGRPAKLAIYSIIAGMLVAAWRKVLKEDPKAELLRTHTDALTVRTKIPVERAVACVGAKTFRLEMGAHQVEPKTVTGLRTCMNLLPLRPELEHEEALTASRLCIFGPPGSGKSHWIRNKYIPAMKAKGIECVLLTPTTELAGVSGAQVLESLIKPSKSVRRVREDVADKILILDEVGLSNPMAIQYLYKLRSAGLVIIGDPYQLTHAGDLCRMRQMLGLNLLTFGRHERDRFGGDEGMYRVLDIMREAIDGDCDPPSSIGLWPAGLDGKLKEAGLRYVGEAEIPQNAVVLGWRHKIVDPRQGKTIHGIQGQTIEGPMVIVDYHCGPRLMYTAVSRARKLEEVYVCQL